MYSVKKCKDILKKKGVKGASRFNKKELSEKIVDVSVKEYQNRKNKNMIQLSALY